MVDEHDITFYAARQKLIDNLGHFEELSARELRALDEDSRIAEEARVYLEQRAEKAHRDEVHAAYRAAVPVNPAPHAPGWPGAQEPTYGDRAAVAAIAGLDERVAAIEAEKKTPGGLDGLEQRVADSLKYLTRDLGR